MALSRRTQRMNSTIWPGFVDAMTGLLLVLMFVLTIFMVIQFVLRETISGQATQLDELAGQVASLTDALGLERDRTATLTTDLAAANDTADAQASRIAALIGERDTATDALIAAQNRITGFEAQVAGLLSQRTDLRQQVAGLEARETELLSEQDQLNLALAAARDEVDAQAELARLAAARRDALQALVADLRRDADDGQSRIASQAAQITALEAAQLADAAAAQALRDRLENADAELTALTLSLEAQRQRAEDTLTLLAAARTARDDAQSVTDEARSQADRQAALLAEARRTLSEQEEQSQQAQRQTALLNEQVAQLRAQVGSLQTLLQVANDENADSDVQIDSLGAQLNTALARAAQQERRARALEEAERRRLEEDAARLAAEAQNLERFRSDFFGQVRDAVEGLDGVRIDGDRFVFSSEVLFTTGSANLSPRGRDEIAKVAGLLGQIASDIPDSIDWIIRVDGHTDDIPLSGLGEFADNWELSQARALSVVRYMEDGLGIPPTRLAANGFGEYQPLNPADTPQARAQNRRIELKLTER